MNSTYGLGNCLVGLGEHEAGLALLAAAVATARRVLGPGHPTSQHFAQGLADARGRLIPGAAAAAGGGEGGPGPAPQPP